MNGVASAFLLTFAGLFPIVNPLEAAPFFLGLTANLPAAERPVLARKAAVNGFALLLGSMALGRSAPTLSRRIPKLVSWEAVQKWDGKLPVNMYGSAAVPFIDVNR